MKGPSVIEAMSYCYTGTTYFDTAHLINQNDTQLNHSTEKNTT